MKFGGLQLKIKYKNPYDINYNPYSHYNNNKGQYTNHNGQYTNHKGQYNNSKNYNYEYPMMQIPIQFPEEDLDGMDEMDINYMKRMYPDICKKIQYFIDEECDKMEYDGSYMYDEYPDKEAIEMITDKIYEKVNKEEKIEVEALEKKVEKDNEKVETSQRGYRRPNRWLRDLVKILLLNEMFGRRRRRYRRRRRVRPYNNYPNYNYGYYNNQYYPDYFE